jgi:hypothetical protein
MSEHQAIYNQANRLIEQLAELSFLIPDDEQGQRLREQIAKSLHEQAELILKPESDEDEG